jgi:glycosyltransferase involved in cell wall biosynthesis
MMTKSVPSVVNLPTGSPTVQNVDTHLDGQRLLFVVNDLQFFLSHWREITARAIVAGIEVHVAASADSDAARRIAALGVIVHTLPIRRGGISPVADLRLLVSLVRLIRQLQPNILHMVTIKPVIWGGIASRFVPVRGAVSYISGLGYIFIADGARAWLLRGVVAVLYRLALNHGNRKIVFENTSDRADIARLGVHVDGRNRIIRGAGVNLSEFRNLPEPEGTPIVLMPARMLIDKGVVEFIEAARLLCARNIDVRFRYAGAPDLQNPASISLEVLAKWQMEGLVEFLGQRDDIPGLMAGAHIIALPSYREGLPRALIEAASCGRAVVTTDVPGCRDAIEPGKTGVLVPARNAVALADAIGALVQDSNRRRQLGAAGRALAERAFRVDAVADAHLGIYTELLRH